MRRCGMIRIQVFQTKFNVTNGIQTYAIIVLYTFVHTASGACVRSETYLRMKGFWNHLAYWTTNNTMCHAQGKGHSGHVQSHKWSSSLRHFHVEYIQTVMLMSA